MGNCFRITKEENEEIKAVNEEEIQKLQSEKYRKDNEEKEAYNEEITTQIQKIDGKNNNDKETIINGDKIENKNIKAEIELYDQLKLKDSINAKRKRKCDDTKRNRN